MRYFISITAAILAMNSWPSLGAEGAASTYPDRPIRLISPFPPGGGNDMMSRAIGAQLADAWGYQVVVDNRPGANGLLACEIVAKAAPDGYTLLMANIGSHGINPALYKKLPYDAVKDFTPVTRLGWTPNILVVPPSLPVGSLKELVALAKAKPGQLTYGSNGSGSSQHLAGVMFSSAFGIDLLHVPYKGTAPVIIDLIAGNLSLSFSNMLAVLPQIKAGRLKPLAATSLKRSQALPEIPAIAETLPGFEAISWWGIVGPAKIPRPIVNKLNQEIAKKLERPELRERFDHQGVVPQSSTPEEFTAYIKSEIAKWTKIVKISGASVD